MTRAFSLLRGWVLAAVVLLTVAVGPLSAVSAEAAGAVDWQATVGYQSKSMAIQENFFFPNNLTVDVGDSITWNLKSAEFHTISFLSGASPASYPLVLMTPSGPSFNPAVAAPSGGTSYSGSGFLNSGILGFGPQKSFKVTFTKAGSYEYDCLVHSTMKGWVHVQPAGTAYPHTQDFYNAKARQSEAKATREGYGLIALGLAKAMWGETGQVTAGIGQLFSTGSIAVMRFLPHLDVVSVGQTVTWTNRDPETPHTVTFNLNFADPLAAFFPSANVTPGAGGGSATMSATTDQVNSGVLGLIAPTTFHVKFTSPGLYQYHCELHDQLGMTGAVLVVPGGTDD